MFFIHLHSISKNGRDIKHVTGFSPMSTWLGWGGATGESFWSPGGQALGRGIGALAEVILGRQDDAVVGKGLQFPGHVELGVHGGDQCGPRGGGLLHDDRVQGGVLDSRPLHVE